ncbi:MAG: PEP-CTERM sorting domain-containing protein [Pseudomonadota bacterium]
MKLKHLVPMLLLAVASAAQALPQFQIHAQYSGWPAPQLDVKVTFSSDYQRIVAADGWFTPDPRTVIHVDGVGATFGYDFSSYPDPHQDYLPPTLRGVWLQSSDDYPRDQLPQLSWDFGAGPQPTFPVLLLLAGGWPYDEGMPWRFYNNSINGSDRADIITVTAVPEPETYAMLLAGIGVVAWTGRRQRWRDVVASV